MFYPQYKGDAVSDRDRSPVAAESSQWMVCGRGPAAVR